MHFNCKGEKRLNLKVLFLFPQGLMNFPGSCHNGESSKGRQARGRACAEKCDTQHGLHPEQV